MCFSCFLSAFLGNEVNRSFVVQYLQNKAVLQKVYRVSYVFKAKMDWTVHLVQKIMKMRFN